MLVSVGALSSLLYTTRRAARITRQWVSASVAEQPHHICLLFPFFFFDRESSCNGSIRSDRHAAYWDEKLAAVAKVYLIYILVREPSSVSQTVRQSSDLV